MTTSDDKWNDALTIFTESVIKPDTKLRSCAHNQKCYNELMWIREHVLEYLNTSVSYTHLTLPTKA